MPHLTLRHAPRGPRNFWPVDETASGTLAFTLENATSFDDLNEPAISTLVIASTSEPLELLSYKPDFPTSFLHFTLYAGEASPFAARALRVLREFPWQLEFETSLLLYGSSREARAQSSSKHVYGVALTQPAHEITDELFDRFKIAPLPFADLSEEARLLLVSAIGERLHLQGRSPVGAVRGDSGLQSLTVSPDTQLAFWSDDELTAITGSDVEGSRARQRLRSAIATPPELALDVAMLAERFLARDGLVDFGEPAAGNGVLFAAARRAVGIDRLNSAQLVELDATSARLLQRKWSRQGTNVLVADFLRTPPQEHAWTMLLANPPYRRSQLVSADLQHVRTKLSSELDLNISARSDLYLYFILRAHAWLRAGAIAAWIVPSEFMVTRYGRALRDYLSKTVSLLRLHTYDAAELLFDNALTSTTVIIYRKESPRPEGEVTVSQGGSAASPTDRRRLPISQLQRGDRWSFANITLPASTTNHVVSDFFDVSRGVATGANSLFILSDEQLLRLGVRPDWVRPMVPRARAIPNGLIKATESGIPIPSDSKWLIDTELSLSEIAEESPLFADYLADVSRKVGSRALVSRRAIPWKQQSVRVAPLLFVYMAKQDSSRPRFIRNLSKAVHLNNYLGLYPKPISGLLDQALDIDDAHSVLLDLATSVLSAYGRSYGKNLLKLEPREVGALPFKLEEFRN
ncbi:Eco57I restriction-modification methylase domain-containing protein [Curtobacterium sp. VKM Ac-2861]|uniref:Eco57I restriction-modification methylase domain-containing protein n=1 Tax=Curtobacterium sp. VKM Ac-2861 TaxID=2739016 RepID=UPI001566C58D|nr:Eco57I restriction-modification methylase domain-containing protein [Curtobacterium sp. VKM Ac-2861]